jgi:hypothetical protein
VISGFCLKIDENCALLGYYRASCGNSLPMFQENPLVPPSRVINVTEHKKLSHSKKISAGY